MLCTLVFVVMWTGIKGLLTECEPCTEKSALPEVFVQTKRQRNEVCAKKEGKYFPVLHTEQTRLIRHLLYGFWFIFFSVYSIVFVFKCCRLPYL